MGFLDSDLQRPKVAHFCGFFEFAWSQSPCERHRQSIRPIRCKHLHFISIRTVRISILIVILIFTFCLTQQSARGRRLCGRWWARMRHLGRFRCSAPPPPPPIGAKFSTFLKILCPKKICFREKKNSASCLLKSNKNKNFCDNFRLIFFRVEWSID